MLEVNGFPDGTIMCCNETEGSYGILPDGTQAKLKNKRLASGHHNTMVGGNPLTSTDNGFQDEENPEYVICPFCKEDDFDLEGLKYHFIKYCEQYRNIKVESVNALHGLNTADKGDYRK